MVEDFVADIDNDWPWLVDPAGEVPCQVMTGGVVEHRHLPNERDRMRLGLAL